MDMRAIRRIQNVRSILKLMKKQKGQKRMINQKRKSLRKPLKMGWQRFVLSVNCLGVLDGEGNSDLLSLTTMKIWKKLTQMLGIVSQEDTKITLLFTISCLLKDYAP